MPPPPRRSVRLLLVRHGQAGGADAGYGPEAPLTAQGRRQAGHVAAALAAAGVAQLVSSPYARAQQTAALSAERLGQRVHYEPRLEEFRMGDEAESTIEEILTEQRYLQLWRPHHSLSTEGETLGAFQERVSAALEDLVRAWEGRAPPCEAAEGASTATPGEGTAAARRIAVFTHGGTIAAAMRWAFGLTPAHNWHADVEIHNASITEIEHWPQGRHPAGAPHATALHRLNDVRHLPAELVTDY